MFDILNQLTLEISLKRSKILLIHLNFLIFPSIIINHEYY